MPERDKRDAKERPVVGRDVPDESKERHTEIAVEVGKHEGETGEKERIKKPA